MARDKRTARAEARRRHRDRLRVEALAAAEETRAEVVSGPSPHERPWWRRVAADLFVVPDIRGDLRSLPSIARRTYAFALPLAGTLAAFLVALDRSVYSMQSQPGEPITAPIARLLFQYVLLPPNVTVAFVGAVLAPRAGWLVAPIVGLVATAAFLALVAIHGPTTGAQGVLTPAVAGETLLAFLPLYVLLGAFAAWYRRWLVQMNERSRQRAEERRKAQARETRRAGRGKTAPARR